MRLTIRLFLLVTLLFAGLASSKAQLQLRQPDPIKWSMNIVMDSATEGSVILEAKISHPWHLYGTVIPEGGPVATTFDFTKSTGVNFQGDFVPSAAPLEVDDPNFGLTVNWWQNDVTFTRKFEVVPGTESAAIDGSVRYMACDDANCMPPRTVTFNETLNLNP